MLAGLWCEDFSFRFCRPWGCCSQPTQPQQRVLPGQLPIPAEKLLGPAENFSAQSAGKKWSKIVKKWFGGFSGGFWRFSRCSLFQSCVLQVLLGQLSDSNSARPSSGPTPPPGVGAQIFCPSPATPSEVFNGVYDL